jgi:hypothetical protein
MSEAVKQIERLRKEYETCTDPARLWEIAAQFREYGQWLDEKRATDKAWKLERVKSRAEAVAR